MKKLIKVLIIDEDQRQLDNLSLFPGLEIKINSSMEYGIKENFSKFDFILIGLSNNSLSGLTLLRRLKKFNWRFAQKRRTKKIVIMSEFEKIDFNLEEFYCLVESSLFCWMENFKFKENYYFSKGDLRKPYNGVLSSLLKL
ncbi:MAG: hypothetical protein WAV31_01285 [Candidatus Moraniibacteriota bacterium]